MVNSKQFGNFKIPSFVLTENRHENIEEERKSMVELFDSDFQVSYGATKSQFFELKNNPTKLSYYFLPRIYSAVI